MTANWPLKICICCGSELLVARNVLWTRLVQEWGLSDYEREYIDRQQGLECQKCGSNLRSMALALAIFQCFGHAGTFTDFIARFKNARIRILEVNEAGTLTQFLSRLPDHRIVKYPGVDMTRMPFADHSFDLVVHSDTLEHVKGPVTALSECYRVLAPGGYCAFTVPIIVDRLSRERTGLPPSFHGTPEEQPADYAVQTEYGSDAWRQLMLAGFQECRIISAEFPAALALVGKRW